MSATTVAADLRAIADMAERLEDMPPGGPETALSRPEGLKPAYGYLRDDERGSG